MLRTFTIFLSIIILCSCKKKDEEYIISGTVINPELNTTVGQVSITLWGTKVSNGVVQNQSEKLGSTYSLSDGSFEFKFKKELFSSIKNWI